MIYTHTTFPHSLPGYVLDIKVRNLSQQHGHKWFYLNKYVVANPPYLVVQPPTGTINAHSHCVNIGLRALSKYVAITAYRYQIWDWAFKTSFTDSCLHRPISSVEKIKMVFGNIVSSPRGSLSPQKALELANIYLESAFNTVDSDITLVLCHDTEVSLYQAKKSVKHGENQEVAKRIAAAYIGLGKVLKSRGHVGGADASFKKAEKLG